MTTLKELRKNYFIAVRVIVSAVLLAACSNAPETPDFTPDVDWDVITSLGDEDAQVSWVEDVQPVLEQRCVVCHGCFDAPCQLKLSSYAGLERGANVEKVYNGSRIRAARPTRLGIDATMAAQWQSEEFGFHPVLGASVARPDADPADRLRDSVLYRMLRLKQLNPQPRTGLLPASVTTSLDRKQVCTAADNVAQFERDNPMWGMPYGMPNLSDNEYQTLVAWIAGGATPPQPAQPSPAVVPHIQRWEAFLNEQSAKQQLVSRYLYEHLFLGHLYFEGVADREFYRLVRSATPPGEPIREIATVRPFDNPEVDKFWYRLRLYDAAIVAKSHVIYSLSDARLERFQQLFIEPDYPVSKLPGYTMPDAANPFKTFAQIPARSRYEFMLDDARYFIMGFIKGPVCRGQVALNVIEDQFWVFFSDPAGIDDNELAARFLAETADYLQLPTSTETLNLLAAYGEFWKLQKEYMAAREKFFQREYEEKGADAFRGIWDGAGSNPNAALTVFRNFDSAAVEFGLLGDYPETAWIIDYPLFERIHYLLVAGFDVYGNVGHQVNSRLFMDFLRMEGEDNFLSYLPAGKRKQIRDTWYKGIREKRQKYFQEPMIWSQIESPIAFVTDDPQRELYELIEIHLGPVAGPVDYLNRCRKPGCESGGSTAAVRDTDKIMRTLHKISREKLSEDQGYLAAAPDVLFVRVQLDSEDDVHYTILRNKSYDNLTSLLEPGDTPARDAGSDTFTVLRGFSGSYPNFFLSAQHDELPQMLEQFMAIDSIEQYQKFIARFGVRRTQPDFWAMSDWFHARYRAEQPVEYGVFDLNRYGNY